MYEILVIDDWKYRTFFYSNEYNHETIELLDSLGYEVLRVNLVDDLDYEKKIDELINYPYVMN